MSDKTQLDLDAMEKRVKTARRITDALEKDVPERGEVIRAPFYLVALADDCDALIARVRELEARQDRDGRCNDLEKIIIDMRSDLTEAVSVVVDWCANLVTEYRAGASSQREDDRLAELADRIKRGYEFEPTKHQPSA